MTKLKSQIVTELNYDKTKKIIPWQNSTTQIETKLSHIVTKLKSSNCDKTHKVKLWQNSQSKIVTKLKKTNYDKTQKVTLFRRGMIIITDLIGFFS